MPSYVLQDKCDGCKGQDKTACQHICPNDLMVLNKDTSKAYNQDVSMCWECYNCVKICPSQAVEVRGYADFVPLGAQVTPMRSSDSIMWTIKFRNEQVKRFKFPIRTTQEGKAEPNGGYAVHDDLDNELMATEPESSGLSGLPTVKNG